MEDTADSRIVNLVSNEGAVFPVPISAANLSVLVRTMINEISDASGGEGQKIKLPYTSAIVAKIIEFLRHHVEEPMRETKKPLISNRMADIVQQWYAHFVALDQQALFELTCAANHMGIEPLESLTCATIASLIKGRTPEEIRNRFNITSEEEA